MYASLLVVCLLAPVYSGTFFILLHAKVKIYYDDTTHYAHLWKELDSRIVKEGYTAYCLQWRIYGAWGGGTSGCQALADRSTADIFRCMTDVTRKFSGKEHDFKLKKKPFLRTKIKTSKFCKKKK